MDSDYQPVFSSEIHPKIYKTKAIQIGTFLGGPLVAGYLIAENYKAFNERDNVKKTWIYTILITILIIIIIFFTSTFIRIPNFVFPLAYSWATYYIVQHFQGRQIASQHDAGGQTYSWWRVIAIGLVGMVITVIAIIVVAAFF